MKTFLSALLPVLATLLIAGCGADGPETAGVSGVVTLEGKPLKNATVIFSPVAEGRPSVATTDDEGHYTLMFTKDREGAEIGEHIVTVTTGGEEYNEDGEEVERPERVPAMYNRDATYKKEVTPGENEIDLVLKAGPIGDASGEASTGGEDSE